MRMLTLVGLLLAGCPATTKTPDDTGPKDTGPDADTDTDTDTDTDSDTDSDTDIDCDEDLTGGSLEGPDCITQELSCGDELISTTKGGTQAADGSEYLAWFCGVVPANDYTGTERVYRFAHPGEGRTATISLSSPCGELDLFAAFWEDDTCPTDANATSECDSDTSAGDGSLDIWNSAPRTYLIYVDGPSGAEENFGLRIDCN